MITINTTQARESAADDPHQTLKTSNRTRPASAYLTPRGMNARPKAPGVEAVRTVRMLQKYSLYRQDFPRRCFGTFWGLPRRWLPPLSQRVSQNRIGFRSGEV
jgi:hypothetical protein